MEVIKDKIPWQLTWAWALGVASGREGKCLISEKAFCKIACQRGFCNLYSLSTH